MSGEARAATASQTVGPFFHFGLTPKPNGRLVGRLGGGEAIALVIRVTDGDGVPLDDAVVEVMQEGVFGRMPTGEDGTCVFETIRPRVSSNESDLRTCSFVCLRAVCFDTCTRASTLPETRRSTATPCLRWCRTTAVRRCSPGRTAPISDGGRSIFGCRVPTKPSFSMNEWR